MFTFLMWCCTWMQDSLSPLQDVHEELYDFRLGAPASFWSPVTAQDVLEICSLKVNASCGAKLCVSVNTLNQECASKKSKDFDQSYSGLRWTDCEADPSEQVPCSVFTSWTICYLRVPAVLKVHVTQDTSSFLVWMFGNIAVTINVFGTSQFYSIAWGKQWQ
jgi:hypothetical protein